MAHLVAHSLIRFRTSLLPINEPKKSPVIQKKLQELYTCKIFRYKKIEPRASDSQIPPRPRSRNDVLCDSGNLYTFAGYNPDMFHYHLVNVDEFLEVIFPLMHEFWRFNFATQTWFKYITDDLISENLASNGLTAEWEVVILSGNNAEETGRATSLYTCRIGKSSSDVVRIETSGTPPLATSGQALVHDGDCMYVIGGISDRLYTCNIYRLNMTTLRWDNLYIYSGLGKYEPEGRHRHEVAFDRRIFYLLGGGNSEKSFDLDVLPAFNLQTRRWRRQKTYANELPGARRCHGAVQTTTPEGRFVFISGGRNGDHIYNDLWRLNLITFKWTLIETCQLLLPMYFHSASVTPEGKMYILGGMFADDCAQTNESIYCTWLRIPKLSEMCWEAILFYNPKLASWNKKKLIAEGIPESFAARLD